MDIKSKSYSHSIYTKVMMFFVVIICFTGSIMTFIDIGETIEKTNSTLDIVTEKSFYESYEFRGKSGRLLSNLYDIASIYKSEENIKAGNTVNEDKIESRKDELFRTFRNRNEQKIINLDYEEKYKLFENEYAEKIANIRQEIINDDLKTYRILIENIEEVDFAKYYATNGSDVFTNAPEMKREDFYQAKAYIMMDDKGSEVYPDDIRNSGRYYSIGRYDIASYDPSGALYVSFDDVFIDAGKTEWSATKRIVTEKLYAMGAYVGGTILSFIYLVLVIGRRRFKDDQLELNFMDRIYTDINLGICMGLVTFWVLLISEIYDEDLHTVIIAITLAIGAVGLLFVLSIFKNIKNRTFFRNTLVFKVTSKIFSSIRAIFEMGSIGWRTFAILIGYPLLLAMLLGFSLVFPPFMLVIPVLFVLGVRFMGKKIGNYRLLTDGIERIKDGDLSHKIEIEGIGELSKLASNINSIGEGLNNAVDSEIRSERLKTELITNVSHDIRTPLTSIITYVDLLKNESDEDKVKGYIGIIEQKAERLKTLTDDLFEASKASSGNVPVNFEKIDIASLISQGLGELNDKIEECNLDFKINHPKEKIYIKADGKLLWRSIENLLSNIFKYALSGSRVYIDIEEVGDRVTITIKNISAYELNIPADELMERFKRGDDSRSTSGSGLGLSIAKSLVDVQKGIFNVEIDGDLFKVIIQMNKYE